MQNITRKAIKSLLDNPSTGPVVTIYAPMHTTASPPHISENQIRLKNLIYKACDELFRIDKGEALASALKEKLDMVHEDLNFWEDQTPGLLICAEGTNVHMFHLPIDTDEYVAVDDNFHLAPVLAMLNDEQSFYILTVTQHSPALFKGNQDGLQPAELQLPQSIETGLNIDEANRKTENQGSASGPSTNSGWYNGRGGARDPHEEDRLRFFRMIDSIVCSIVDRSLPLILAGITAETVEYRNISKHPQILTETITGSFSSAVSENLFEAGHKIIENEIIQPTRTAVVEEFNRLEGANPGKVAQGKEAIQQAAEQGRVDKLLTMMGRYTTDTIRDSAAAVSKITFPDKELSKSLNRIALQVWQMSGTIINLHPEEMPHQAPMLARLRY